MIKPMIPSNERLRLEDLYSFDVLDTEPEMSYDDITHLAASICDAPIAMINLIDSDRVWFKSVYGGEQGECERDIAFCAHSITQEASLIINDSRQDERFHDNPMTLADPPVIFYAGTPLKTPNGYNIGSLCIVDHKPRQLSVNQIKAIEVLARQIVHQLELRRSHQKISHQNSLIKQQHEQIVQSAKLSSMGLFAAGMAHEINNPLAIILSHNQVNKKLLEKKEIDKLASSFETIDKTGKRIKNIIDSLRKISRDESSEALKPSNLNEILDDSLSIVSSKIKESGAEIIINIDKSIEIFCHPGELSQVLINLVGNSCDAIKKEDERWVEIKSEETSEYFIVSVIDSGNGISHKIASKIMDPFFTTKDIGQGTGLGLSISKGLLKSQKAELEYDYECENTKFDIKIPKSLLKRSA